MRLPIEMVISPKRAVMNRFAILMHFHAWALIGYSTISGVANCQTPPKAMLALPDQFERKQDIAQFQGDVLVILYGDKDGMPANKGLGEKLQLQYHPPVEGVAANKLPVTPLPGLKEGQRSPDVHVLPVVCLGNSPSPIKNFIRSRIKKEAGESPVLLDFEGKMKAHFGLKEGQPNLVVIDASGRVRMKLAGELDAASYAKLLETIDVLRKEALR
jgi:hypothetical protein